MTKKYYWIPRIVAAFYLVVAILYFFAGTWHWAVWLGGALLWVGVSYLNRKTYLLRQSSGTLKNQYKW
mgnify:CR=1 FL=1